MKVPLDSSSCSRMSPLLGIASPLHFSPRFGRKLSSPFGDRAYNAGGTNPPLPSNFFAFSLFFLSLPESKTSHCPSHPHTLSLCTQCLSIKLNMALSLPSLFVNSPIRVLCAYQRALFLLATDEYYAAVSSHSLPPL